MKDEKCTSIDLRGISNEHTFLDAYYEPENCIYHLERDLIEGLISDGHKIKIICPTPTRGIDKETREKYKNKIFEEKYNGSVEVNRFKAPQEGKNQ
ncbi:MAG: hypothetical protein ACLSGB_15855 [Dorea sp.]